MGDRWNPRAYFERVAHGAPGTADPELVARYCRWLGPWLRLWFRPSFEGLEHLPAARAFVVAANHSGLGIADVLCLVLVWAEHFGTARRVAGFAHPLGFALPGVRSVMRGLGIVPSTYRAADAALADGVPLIIFPGGDHEGFRPIWQARRTGFVRIAKKHGVPIVPLAIHGSHVTVPILWRSRLLAWFFVWPPLIGIKRVPVTLLGLVTCIAVFAAARALGGVWPAAIMAYLSWTLLPTSYLPWFPSRIRMRFLAPLEPSALGDDLAGESRRVARLIEADLRSPPPLPKSQ